MAIETPGLTMPGLTAWNRTAGHVASFALTAAVIVGVGFGSSTIFVGAAAAKIDPQDAEFLASVNKIIAEFGAQPDASTSQACDRIVGAAINMDAVTQSAISQRWVRMSPQQRSAFRAAARRWAVRDCVRQNQGNEGNPLEFLGIKHVENGERLLATRSSKPAHTIIWRLHGGGKARAVDVVVDGRSAILSIRNETRTLLDRSNDDIDVATEMLGR
jgi:hypothetical protein